MCGSDYTGRSAGERRRKGSRVGDRQQFDRRNELARMSRAVFRPMKQEAQNRGRQLSPSDQPDVQNRLGRRGAQLVEPARNRSFHESDESRDRFSHPVRSRASSVMWWRGRR